MCHLLRLMEGNSQSYQRRILIRSRHKNLSKQRLESLGGEPGHNYWKRFVSGCFANVGVCVCVCVCVCVHTQSCLTLFNPMDCSRQAPLSMAFSRQEHRRQYHPPSPGYHLDPRIEPMSPALAGRFFTTVPPGKPSGSGYAYFNLLIYF